MGVIRSEASPQEWEWLEGRANAPARGLAMAFVATPRFIGKKTVQHSGAGPWHGGSLQGLVRGYWLLRIDAADPAGQVLDALFETAETNEAVALLRALPRLARPEGWLLRATDAVRSNIGPVFDAIAFDNPYPMRYFPEAAWNQLILKCIFNDKPLSRIMGLRQRANAALARSVSALADERWAAGRSLPPQAWQLVSGFPDERLLADVRRLLASERPADRHAALLVCREADYLPAKKILEQYPEPVLPAWHELES